MINDMLILYLFIWTFIVALVTFGHVGALSTDLFVQELHIGTGHLVLQILL